MRIPPAVREALQNKYIAATLVALIWSTFIHDLGLPFVVREARELVESIDILVPVASRLTYRQL